MTEKPNQTKQKHLLLLQNFGYVSNYTACSEIKLLLSRGSKYRYKHPASKIFFSEFIDCLVSKNAGLGKVSAGILRAITHTTIEMVCCVLV